MSRCAEDQVEACVYQKVNERLEGNCAVVRHELVVNEVHILILDCG